MRVIAGIYRSRVLFEVDSEATRETKDRVKESIFNSIQNDLVDADVLDLFAGSGSLGIEALSRGARYCDFVDVSNDAVKTIKANIKSLDLMKQTSVYYGSYLDFLNNTDKTFDCVILDPPYALDVIEEAITIIAKRKVLKETGIVVCLYSKNNSLKQENFGIIEYKVKQIGITKISFMKWG
jgi:16S rRNA (guanine(966)-N(2))-methyltransferase RsmD